MKTALIRIGIVFGACTGLVLLTMFAPVLLRRIDALNVARVQVVGAHFMSADDVVMASGITRTSSVFDDAAPWIAKLRKHPLVADVTIERQVPSTMVIRITEVLPIAFARTPELRAIDENGRVLPANPALADMDLPVLSVMTRLNADGTAADAETRKIAAFIAKVTREEPGLLDWISEVGVHGDAVKLVLRTSADADVLVTADPTLQRLRELHMTLISLSAPRVVTAEGDSVARDVGPELSHVKRIDGRFREQIVVALDGGTS